MVEPTQQDVTPGGTTLREARRRRLAAIDTPNYARTVEVALKAWEDWADQEGIETLEEVTKTHMVRWINDDRHGLRGKMLRGELTASTVNNYYRCVRASFTWWQKMGFVAENPAMWKGATDELPSADESETERQFWKEGEIRGVRRHADELVEAAIDDHGHDSVEVLTAMRNRLILLLLAYSGARGAELFRDPKDPLRDGLRWSDVDAEKGLLHVLGKNRTREEAMLSEPIRGPLERYERLLDPAPEWPVIPTLSKSVLCGDGVGSDDPLGDLRSRGESPPALTVRSVRNVLKQLSEGAEVEIEGGYLKPHGGRRGLGDRLYGHRAELAQEALRHQDIETTHRAYREHRSERVREEVDAALGSDASTGDDVSSPGEEEEDDGAIPESYQR